MSELAADFTDVSSASLRRMVEDAVERAGGGGCDRDFSPACPVGVPLC